MPSYFPYELGELLEADHEDHEDHEAHDGEASPRRRPVRTAARGNVVPQRPESGYATKAELTTTANRLDGRIAVNTGAVKTLDGRVASVSSEQSKLRNDVKSLQGGLNDVRNMSMLLPLLSTQKTRDVTTNVTGTAIASGDKVVVDSGDTFSKMLPLLLFSGAFGGSSSSGGSSSGGMFGGGDGGGGIMLIAMMMMMQK
jgi:uncharacterized membrane protein YgcG